MTKYYFMDIESWNKENPDDSYYDYGGYRTACIKEVDGKKEILGTDGGEPEDASFCRDYNWIVSALNEAYEQGLKDAKVG